MTQLLSQYSFYRVSKPLARYFGSNDTALLLSHLIDLQGKFKEKVEKEGHYYQTNEQLTDYCNLKNHVLRDCLKELYEAGLVDIVKKGLPAKNHFFVKLDKVLELLEEVGSGYYISKSSKGEESAPIKVNEDTSKENLNQPSNHKWSQIGTTSDDSPQEVPDRNHQSSHIGTTSATDKEPHNKNIIKENIPKENKPKENKGTGLESKLIEKGMYTPTSKIPETFTTKSAYLTYLDNLNP